MRVPLRERSFGDLIGLCFSVTAGNFGLLFLLAFMMNLPGTVLASLQALAGERPGGVVALLNLVGFLIVFVTASILQAATIRVVAGTFTGEAAPLADCLRLAVRKVWPLIGYGMVTGMIQAVGFVMLIVPGVIFATWYYLGPPALVVEDLGVGRAMTRSKRLSEGRRWEILGYMLVTWILFQGVTLAVSTILVEVVDPRLAPWVNLPIASLLGTPAAVAPIVYYFNARVAAEGLDLEHLSALIERIGEEPSPGSSGQPAR